MSDERTAVVKHEALHLLFKHLFRVEIGSRNMRLFNIAADLVVNQFVEPWPLPEGRHLAHDFSGLGFTTGSNHGVVLRSALETSG